MYYRFSDQFRAQTSKALLDIPLADMAEAAAAAFIHSGYQRWASGLAAAVVPQGRRFAKYVER